MRRVVAIPLAVISLLVLAGCERWALDRQMEKLCKTDGGVRVYETVTLPASEFSNTGQPLARYWKPGTPEDERLGPDYRYVSKREVLVGKNAKPETGEGQLVRLHWAIYRRADNRVLGEQVEYRRNGGDLFTFGFQPSNTSCPRVDRDVAQIIFVKGD